MARPVYPHELSDPDFSWLLSSYRESHPELFVVEITCLPVTLVTVSGEEFKRGGIPVDAFVASDADARDRDEKKL